MNRVFRLVWSCASHSWVVVSELTARAGKGRGRAGRSVDARGGLHAASSTPLRAALLAALALTAASGAQAADRYWDVNGGSAGSGGTGTWDTSTGYWNSAADGVAGPFVSWNNAGLDRAFFAGTAGTITLGAPITANALTFNVGGYTLNGSTLTLAGTTPTIAGSATINSVLAGTAGLTKTAAGVLALNGSNTFSGGIAINGGSLAVTSDAALGAASNGISLAAGAGLAASGGPLAATRNVTLSGGIVTLTGNGVGYARFTGDGRVNIGSGVTMGNAASDYNGQTTFYSGGTYAITSVGNLGEASAVGAPTTAADGLIVVQAGGGLGGTLNYAGSGNSSNRDWRFANTSSGGTALRNIGTGMLSLSGNVELVNSWNLGHSFQAVSADMEVLGVISSASDRTVTYTGGAGRAITLGGVSTYTGPSTVTTISVFAPVLTDIGTASSFGVGTAGGINLVNGAVRYTGGATSSNRAFTSDGATTLANDGSGALALSGAVNFVAGGVDTLTLGGSYSGSNTLAGTLAGTGNLQMNGAGRWVLQGNNSYAGTTTVQAGTLVAGSSSAFGLSKGLVVNGGTLDLDSLDITAPSLAGSGGNVALGSGTLTVNATSGSTAYAGSIGGAGGLAKLGAGTQTLSGSNTYTGATTLGGGTLALDFAAAGAPASNIINAASALTLAGGTLSIKGGTGSNAQAFNGLDITAGSNRIAANAGTGGTLTTQLGAINRSGGLVDFAFNAGSTLATTHADGALGGWATVNGTDYAQVSGGIISAFTSYANKDDASQWLDGDIVSDEGGAANSAYFGALTGNVALGGLKIAAAAASTVNVGAGNTLGVDGSIIISPSAASASQTLQGGALTGGAGGSPLGVLQNSAGTFTVASTIVDNGGATAFTAGGSGSGSVVLAGANTYTGATTVSGGTLQVGSIANGGVASSIGASSNAASNLMIENGTLRYTGGSVRSDRGFTLVNGGPSRTIQVDGSAELAFDGVVTSPDDAGFSKTGTGTLVLGNATNDFTGPVTVSAGLVSVAALGNGGSASGLGAGSADPSQLLLQTGGGLQYTGATSSTDRGFTLASGVGRVDVSQAATTLTNSGTVVGAGTLNKDGAGTLVLAGTNPYTGGSTVNAGTLRAGSARAFGGTASGSGAGRATVNAGATLDLDGYNVWVGGLHGAGTVTLGSGTLQLSTGAVFTGAISGTGGIQVSGGTQTLNGCGSSYTGGTTIRSASISTDCLADGGQNSGIGASGAASANLTLISGSLIYTGSNATTDRGIQLTGNGGIVINDASTTLGFGGLVQGAGQLQKQGAGTLVLGSTNSYTGGTYVRGGSVQAGADNAFGTGYLSLDNVAGVSVILDGHDANASYLSGGGTTGGDIALGSGVLTVTNGTLYTGSSTYGGAISGSGSLVKAGTGIQYLAGSASRYTGTTTVSGGQLQVAVLADGGQSSSIGASGNAASNLVLNGGTLTYVGAGSSTDRLLSLVSGTNSALDASGTGAVHFTNTGALAFSGASAAQRVTLTGSSSADNSLALQIADNGSDRTALSKTGTGTWILRNQASTYTGVTTISGGVLGVDRLADGGQASSIGQSSSAAANLVIGSGATLRYTGTGDSTDRLFTLSTGSSVIESSGTGAIVFSNTGSAAYAGSGNRTLGLGGSNTGLNIMGGSIINGAGGITTVAKNDGGTWALTGNNTYTGNTVINDGILQIGAGGTTGSVASSSIIVAGGTLAFARTDSLVLGSTISGAGNVVQQGAGTTALTAANTYTGGTRIIAGTLQLGDGGASGSLLGNVSNDGTFAFNRSDAYTFAGLVSGSGGLLQRGSGTTVLTGANGYTGTTTVQNGTLLVNGDQSAATGQATVQSGAVLGGTGTLGGNVNVDSGGALSPGATGAAGTLTINGSLALAAGSALNYQFGQANVVGGALNDLTVVHGDLALDGTLNASTTPGGSFGPGLYRVISYDGALSGAGLTLGSTPSGSYQVQTAMAGQVNLLSSSGLTLNFWDGAAGHGNALIDGGNGVWQNSAGNDNWTDQTGQYNAPYTDGDFAIFAGTAGTVTVDNALGNVVSSGMQFAVDGYRVQGDAVQLAAGQNSLRVGDGTAAGNTMTATLDALLSGTGGIVKDDRGTLVLTAANTYSGGTTVRDGVLQIRDDAQLGQAAAALSFEGGTLRNTGSTSSSRAVTLAQQGGTFDTVSDLLLAGAVSGAGGLTKTGAGTLTLAGSNSYLGGTVVDAGRLVVSADDNLGNANGALSLGDAVLQTTAVFTAVRDVALNGTGSTLQTDADLTLQGALSGSGALNKTGGGALVLAADATYSGGTHIADGTLQLGDGGSRGSLLGDVRNDGALLFNRADSLAFAGLVTGSGSLLQVGSGTTVLSANNSYAGTTTVAAGTLVVNGDQRAATGATTVAGGATLGGKGTLGGDVSLDDGATLSPGDLGIAPGTLTVAGNLAMADATALAVNLGQANVVGGPLNDLVKVEGDLQLDGVLDVSVSSGGSFDPGIYRIIGYAGSLTDNGLVIGSVPTPDYFLQTSIDHQVNLVNTAGLDVNYWDGNGARGDGNVAGGDGLWQATAGNDNWTVLDGSINAPYQDSAFAVFAGAAGTVTVDASLGQVRSGGMQFASDGYRVQGDDIVLTSADSVLRVGDGTTDGSGMRATVASVLGGASSVTKSDLGTLVLAADNTYVGTTTVRDGVLQLGEGGTAGSILGDVVNNATLAFDRSDRYRFDGTISGSGGVVQQGSGITELSADNRYSGESVVGAGTLLINGDQSAATGITRVQAGGTLGGQGIIGGAVSVADGGTLSPGASAGTLTINGNLQLAAGARLQYELGQAGTPGGALNDLTVVHGDLLLDGTLDVTASAGGSFGAGVYRIFNYDGSLTNNGLALGSVPSSDLFIQTSIANQVNLVNTDGLTLSFWDGEGHANNGGIEGGAGTWRLADNDYWTEASGALNAPYSNGSFAVFGGSAGVVQVDNSLGQVTATGLQFQSDGYVLQGGALVLSGGAASIRVGDGSAPGAAYVATLNNSLQGNGLLVKDDLGTLVLGGDNTYSGGTSVRAGTLQVARDANLGAASGVLTLEEGTLHTTASFSSDRSVGLGGSAGIAVDAGTTLTLTNAISGTGSLDKRGAGTLLLQGASAYSGETTVTDGTLAAGATGVFNASTGYSVLKGATLDLAGFNQTVATLANAGRVESAGAAGTTLTVQGNYNGQGGTLVFNTVLGDDSSRTDRLVVNGQATGTTTVRVNNAGGNGAQTQQGIKLIDVQGASSGTFALQGDYVFQGDQAVVAGAYAYRLYQGSTDSADGDWYLRSALNDGSAPTDPTNPLYQPGVPLYESYAGLLRQMTTLGTLLQRTGDRAWGGAAPAQGGMDAGEGQGAWLRVHGNDQTFKPDYSTSGTRYDLNQWTTEAGVDGTVAENGDGRWVAGATLQYGRYQAHVDSAFGQGRLKGDSYGLGGSLTWYASNGLYVDGQMRWTRLDTDLQSTTLARLMERGNQADTYAASVELGQRIALNHAWSIIPQAQLSYGRSHFDAFDDAFGARVSQHGQDGSSARLGVAFDYASTRSGTHGAVATRVYTLLNLYQDMGGRSSVQVAGTTLATQNPRFWGGLGVGAARDWAQGRYSLFGEVQASTGLEDFGDSHSVNGTLGFRMRW